MSIHTEFKLFKTLVLLAVLGESETWKITEQDKKIFDTIIDAWEKSKK